MTNLGSLASIAHLSFDKIRFSTLPFVLLSFCAAVNSKQIRKCYEIK